MKVVILAGGFGTRIAEESVTRPKPMVEIGGIPMLVHIMHLYSSQGFNDFVIACGYKGEMIKEYFTNYHLKTSDWHIHLRDGTRKLLGTAAPDWDISVIDTGMHTMTGGRLKRLSGLLGKQTFMVTYGDCLSNVDIQGLLAFHRGHGRLATVTAVCPPARFGSLEIVGTQVNRFVEKPSSESVWINGGFFVMEPNCLDFVVGDSTPLEKEPLEQIAAAGELMAYQHTGFWQPMDTVREKQLLEKLWSAGNAPWIRISEHDHSPILSRQTSPGDGSNRLQGPVARNVA